MQHCAAMKFKFGNTASEMPLLFYDNGLCQILVLTFKY